MKLQYILCALATNHMHPTGRMFDMSELENLLHRLSTKLSDYYFLQFVLKYYCLSFRVGILWIYAIKIQVE